MRKHVPTGRPNGGWRPGAGRKRSTPDQYREKFLSLCLPEPNTGCWLWMASTTRDGYGKWHAFGAITSVGAHRIAWGLARGPVLGGLHVLHRCDNRICVNPDHLFLGTHADNMADMAAKGRARAPRGPRSERRKETSRHG